MRPKHKGEVTEAIVLASLLKRGYSVSIPFGNNLRYDFILDDGKQLLRAQCKTGRLRNGTIIFNTASSGFRSIRYNYKGQADVFLVYCPGVKGVYIVPVEELGNCAACLRVDPLKKHGTRSTVKWARKYLMKRLIDRMKQETP